MHLTVLLVTEDAPAIVNVNVRIIHGSHARGDEEVSHLFHYVLINITMVEVPTIKPHGW